MTANAKDLTERLAAAATECRELLREVHAAQKDLTTMIRHAHEAETSLHAYIHQTLDGFGDEIRAGVLAITRTSTDEALARLRTWEEKQMDGWSETVKNCANLMINDIVEAGKRELECLNKCSDDRHESLLKLRESATAQVNEAGRKVTDEMSVTGAQLLNAARELLKEKLDEIEELLR